jgi:hypothetical protein
VTFSIDMGMHHEPTVQQGHAAYTSSMPEHGHASWTCSMNMQHSNFNAFNWKIPVEWLTN